MIGLVGSLSMLRLLIWLFWLPRPGSSKLAEFSMGAARALDVLLQDYAYRAFDRPRIRTGVAYDANVPSNLSGIKVSGLRLRSGSLRNRGFKMYKEFQIPVGVIEQPYVERLVLVYQNLGNFSARYYSLPGYIYLAPVLGLLAYDASNLSTTNLPELDIKASDQPIKISFSDVKPLPVGSSAKCVSIDLQGSLNFSNVLSDNTCTTFQQGHFSIVIESIAPSPAQVPPPPSTAAPPTETPIIHHKGKKNKSKVWIIIVLVVGGLILMFLLGLLVVCASKYKHKKKLQQMERAAEAGEALEMTKVGSTKAPTATVTRTQPTVETEYRP